MPTLNKNNAAVKRIMQEAKELANDPSTDYTAAPLEDDIFEWHCTLRGPSDTDFEGGLYHFRILLPAEYPFRPPSIMILTPNGRFELNTKICISFTNYHEELWQPAWGVRTAIIGLQGFFPLKGQAAVGVGSIEYPSSERKRLAAASRNWICPHCEQSNLQLLPDPSATTSSSSAAMLLVSAPCPEESSVPCAPIPKAEHETNDDLLLLEKGQLSEMTAASSLLLAVESGSSQDLPRSDENIDATTQATPDSSSNMETAAQSTATLNRRGTTIDTNSLQSAPLLLDTAICVLLVLVLSLLCKKIF